MTLFTVLWEDQCSTKPNNFGLHRLLLACVADEMSLDDPHSLDQRVQCMPAKGNAKLKAMIDKTSKIGCPLSSGPVLAVFDEDQVRRLYSLDGNSCIPSVVNTIREAAASGVQIALLVRNAEDLIDTCCRALRCAKPGCKPTPMERDRILNAAANSDDPNIRKQICDELPSYSRIVRLVTEWRKQKK